MSAAQLRTISDVSAALAGAGVEHRLTGGWALDFLVGEVTRPHGDVDFDLDAAAAELQHLVRVGLRAGCEADRAERRGRPFGVLDPHHESSCAARLTTRHATSPKRGYATLAGAAPRPQDAADLALLERFAGA